ncbi:MAG: hypothetical protein R3D51_17780 [Hyphomicrobiaceae bacterium]
MAVVDLTALAPGIERVDSMNGALIVGLGGKQAKVILEEVAGLRALWAGSALSERMTTTVPESVGACVFRPIGPPRPQSFRPRCNRWSWCRSG